MKFGTSIIILLLSIVALVAEFILYMIFGVGAAFSGDASSLTGVAMFFGFLIVFTIAVGILAPISSFIGFIIEKIVDTDKYRNQKENNWKKSFFKDAGTSIYILLLSLVVIFAIVGGIASNSAVNEEVGANNQLNNSLGQEETQNTQNPTNVQTTSNDSKEIKNENNYLESLEIQSINVTMGYGEYDIPQYDDPKPAVQGKIKNLGDKTISEVELTIYYLDSSGNRISETQYYPVNTRSIFGDDSPLKPNYVRDFGYIVDEDAPNDWGKEIEAEITDYVISKQ